MQLFLDVYGFLSVVLRGFILCAQSLTLGGLAFLTLLAWPLAPELGEAGEGLTRRAIRLVFWSACALAAAETASAASLIVMLVGTLEIPVAEAVGARAALIDLVVATVAVALAFIMRMADFARLASRVVATILGLLLLCAQTGATHAASRPEGAAALPVAEFLHMLSAGVWIGGIPYFLIAFAEARKAGSRRLVCRRFSFMAIGAVMGLVAGGSFMTAHYVETPSALYGTSYGVMLCAKIALLLGLLFLGAMNFLAVRRLRDRPNAPMARTRRFAETEIGIGLTALFCAASLTSLPPARDLADRASLAEIFERVEPHWPVRLESPDHAALSTSLLDERVKATKTTNAPASETLAPALDNPPPRNAEDIAWSEYNHHWAGLFVIAMGALALLERNRRLASLARHWPLIFLGLAGFLLIRGDEAVWPLGNLGLIESLRDPEIAQHRFFTALIVAFGVFEWRVRLGRFEAAWPSYVFPLTTAIAAAFLLIHSHALTNVKEELLIEITHTPLALVGVLAGWARWLELRLDGKVSRIAGFVWPAAFILAGVMLLFYREA